MLADAYYRLGVKGNGHIHIQIRHAWEYFMDDREHFIEVVEPKVPEYEITPLKGVICRMIPLARSVTTEAEQTYTRRKTTVLNLMITEEEARYVLSQATDKLTADPMDCQYGYPTYRFASLEDITPALQVLSPQEIRPLATPEEWKIYGMIFAAIAKYSRHLDNHYIPHKTERAMLTVKYSVPAELSIGGKTLQGKLIPLAQQLSTQEEMRQDHQYGCTKDLCLWIGNAAPQYLLRTRHVYRYFRKVIYDDVPGGWAYESTDEKQETTYDFIALEDAPEGLCPLYY